MRSALSETHFVRMPQSDPAMINIAGLPHAITALDAG